MDEDTAYQPNTTIELTAEIIAAYVSGNHVQVAELPALIASVRAALAGLASGAPVEDAGPEKPTPAQIRKSITPDALVSFEDGKSYKTLKRHLGLHGLTPDAYRAKYGLAVDYPMTTANYSAQRSKLAQAIGLGRKRLQTASQVVEEPVTVAKTRGRKKKVVETA